MLGELVACNAAFAVIKQTLANGRELADCGKAISDYVTAKDTLQQKANKMKLSKLINGIHEMNEVNWLLGASFVAVVGCCVGRAALSLSFLLISSPHPHREKRMEENKRAIQFHLQWAKRHSIDSIQFKTKKV